MSRRPPGLMRPSFTMVNGISDRQGMPRIGKLRLGEKGVSTKGKEYPKEIDYFRCDPDAGLLPAERKTLADKFAECYGARPSVLTDVFFPSDDRSFCFPNALEAWARTQAGSKRICHGDGINASRLDMESGNWTPRPCCHVAECDIMAKEGCKLVSRLRVILPRVSMSGYWQIDTGSQASTSNIVDLLNQLDRLFGRLTSIPLVLSREPQPMTFEGKTTTHFILHLRAPNVDLQQLKELVGRNQFALTGSIETEIALDDEDVPEEIIPASVQEPAEDPELEKRVDAGFDILGTKPAERLVAKERYKGRLGELLHEISARIDRRNAAATKEGVA